MATKKNTAPTMLDVTTQDLFSIRRTAKMNDLRAIKAELDKRLVKCTLVEHKNIVKLGYPVLRQVRNGSENSWCIEVVATASGVETRIRDNGERIGLMPKEIFDLILHMDQPETRQQRRAAERKVSANRLRGIFKIDLMNLQVSHVTLGDSALMRWLDEIGEAEEGIIKVQHQCCGKVEKDALMRERFEVALTSGIDFNGCNYVPLCVTSSDARNCTSAWVKRELYHDVMEWMRSGVDLESLVVAPNKLYVYLGLDLSSSRPFFDVFGTRVDMSRAVIVHDKKVVIEAAKVSLVTKDGCEPVEKRKVELNLFDGQILIEKAITKGQACTVRVAFLKGLAVPFEIKRWMEEHQVDSIVDIWGNAHHRDDIDMIIPESVFKGAHWYASYQQYIDALKEADRDMCVCVQEHPARPVSLAYQGVQTLVGCTDEDMDNLVNHSAAMLNSYTNPQRAAKLLGGHMAKAAAINPNLLVEPRIAERLQQSYTSRLNEAKGARLLASGIMPFIASDPVAMMEHVCGLEVKGCLNADECYCRSVERGPVVFVRYPHINNSSFVHSTNVRRPSVYLSGPTLFISVHDLTALVLRADFDGDHVWISNNKALLQAVDHSQAFLDKSIADWSAPGAEKKKWYPGMLADYLRTLTVGSEIGIYANNATRMWARCDKYITSDRTHLVPGCIIAGDWLEWGANILIDKTKHGGEDIQAPEHIRLTYSSKVTRKDKYGRDVTTYELDRMPGFLFYAKRMPKKIEAELKAARDSYESSKKERSHEFFSMWKFSEAIGAYISRAFEHIVMDIVNGEPKFRRHPLLSKKYNWVDGVGTRYAMKIAKTVPEVLRVDGSDQFSFTSLMLTREPYGKGIPGLCEGGENVNGEWVGQGLFCRLAFARSKELEAMNTGETFDPTKYHSWAAYRAAIALEQIREFAEENGSTLEHAYDVIVRSLFGEKRRKMPQLGILKDAFWEIFGEMAVETLKMNAEKEIAPLAVSMDDPANAQPGCEFDAAGSAEFQDADVLDDGFWMHDDVDDGFICPFEDDPEADAIAEAYADEE